MAMRKSSCKNTPQYLRSCCSPIGKNNTKDFSAQSGGSIGRAVWKWSGKSRFSGAFSASLLNLRRFISLPNLFPLAPTDRPWVSEDVLDPSTFDKKLHSAHASSGLFSWTNVDRTPERGRNRVYTHCSQKVCLLRFSVLIKMKLVKKMQNKIIVDDFCLKETPFSEVAFYCHCQNVLFRTVRTMEAAFRK